MRFKSPEIITEMQRAHPKVQAMALYLDSFFVTIAGHDGMVTDVERTQDEYNRIYGETPYLGPRPHLGPPSHAVDWRSTEFTEPEIERACKHMNENWPRKDGKPTLMCHQVAGGAFHFHLQAEV